VPAKALAAYRRRMMRTLLALGLLLLTACPTEAEDTRVRVVLEDPLVGTCGGFYWPVVLDHYPLIAVPLEAPAPPYEILSFAATLRSGAEFAQGDRTCQSTAGLRVSAFISDEAPASEDLGAAGFPTLGGVIAESVLTSADEGEEPVAVAELNSPVTVETEGTLWVVLDATEDSGAGTAACVVGCSRAGDGDRRFWIAEDNVYDIEPGWYDRPDVVEVSVTVRHDPGAADQ